MKTIISDEFPTKLGIVRSWLESDRNIPLTQYNSLIVATSAHKITLETFELSNEWILPHMSCESSCGWRWFIEKINDEIENLVLYCELINPTEDIEYDGAIGEHLDAVLIENKTDRLHIGTEDGEIMNSRASIRDCMPQRFEQLLGFDSSHYSFTEHIDFGFKTVIPQLQKNEKPYFHYLVATNPIKPDLKSPDEEDISTWFAVDCLKSFLDERIENI